MDFPGNSHKDKENKEPIKKEKIEKVVTGEVVQKKKPLGERLKGIFFDGEFKNATRYITYEVLIPAFKNMVVDATSKGVERVIYGESTSSRRRYDQPRPRVSYNNPVDRYSSRYRPGILPDQPPLPSRRSHGISDIVIISREEAELVIERLNDIVDKYDVASVADLYDLVGLPSSYVDNKWGWTSLAYANIRQIREGFLIDLPPVEPI